MPKQFDIKEFEPYKNYVIDASAGTGKTYNIIEIVKKLVLENICKLNEILIVTFTDKAAGELKDRIRKGLGELYTEDSSIYTIHSFCDNVIKEFGVSSNLPLNMTLVSDENLYNFINEYIRNDDITTDILTAFKLKEFDCKYLAKGLVNGINKYYLNKDNEEDETIISMEKIKSEDVDFDRLYITTKYLKDAYISYLNYKKENNYKTFDDMIRQVRESIIDDKCDLKDKLRKKYKYAIIDEFQDTNQLQFDIFSNIFLCENHNIIVVGDPKQSIYSFQGADVDVYLKAKKIIVDNGGIDCILMKNYRSRKEQVESCNNLFNLYNFKGTNFTDSSYCVKKIDNKEYKCLYDGHEIDAFWIASEIDDDDYAKIVAREIVNCCEYDENGRTRLQITDKNDANYNYRNVTFKDFAILGRDRYCLFDIINELKRLGIPFVRYKDTGLFDGKECSDWIALFEAIDAIDFTGNNRNI